jgi:hypothetical protein
MTTSKLTTTDSPRIFLTDYASYNNGTQFEFGHWVELDDFSDADELQEYITNHFEECDKKSPLGFGSTREEVMITDFENFPRALYSESMSSKEWGQLYEYINLDDNDKAKVTFIIEQGEKFDYAMSKYQDVYLTEDSDNAKYELFEMFYPDAEEMTSKNDYVTIDYDRFIKENYTEFEFKGIGYLVDDSWNH